MRSLFDKFNNFFIGLKLIFLENWKKSPFIRKKKRVKLKSTHYQKRKVRIYTLILYFIFAIFVELYASKGARTVPIG